MRKCSHKRDRLSQGLSSEGIHLTASQKPPAMLTLAALRKKDRSRWSAQRPFWRARHTLMLSLRKSCFVPLLRPHLPRWRTAQTVPAASLMWIGSALLASNANK